MGSLIQSLLLFLLSTQTVFAGTAVYVIHGTYDATGNWPRAIEGRATFGSELIRDTDWRLEPYLWRTSIKHEARVAAAQSLAREIDADPATRIVLVGYSHGGNVALEAVQRCRRRVDAVICLATPHIYLTIRGEKGGRLLPVYCSAGARERIGKIYNFVCRGDRVVSLYAGFRKGISEQTAIESTKSWRQILNNPRLIDDGGPIREVFEDFLDVEPVSNLVVRPKLTVADHNIEIACQAAGANLHQYIHSRRMGWLVGALIAQPEEALPYLESLCIPEEENPGEPVRLAAHLQRVKSLKNEFQFSGWLLSEVQITSFRLTKPNGKKWDVDGSRPDVSFKVSVGDAPGNDLSDTVTDAQSVIWRPWKFVPRDQTVTFELFDRDAFGGHDVMGKVRLGPENGILTRKTDQFLMRTVWVKAHY